MTGQTMEILQIQKEEGMNLIMGVAPKDLAYVNSIVNISMKLDNKLRRMAIGISRKLQSCACIVMM